MHEIFINSDSLQRHNTNIILTRFHVTKLTDNYNIQRMIWNWLTGQCELLIARRQEIAEPENNRSISID